MDLQQDPQTLEQQNQQPHDQENNTSSSKSSYVCRQGSTRWAPTSDQVRILKELYYNNGVRSPSAEQIQRISARLRQYGKIEGKNVFYWFQNHKARERQKKRFTVDTTMATMQRPPPTVHHHAVASTPGVSCCSAGVLGVGHLGSNMYGPPVMEKSFRDCSISPSGSSNVGESMNSNFGWIGVGADPCPYLERKKPIQHVRKDYFHAGIKTLPLFPMHGEDSYSGNLNSHDNWPRTEDGKSGCGTSLELSLNSYTFK